MHSSSGKVGQWIYKLRRHKDGNAMWHFALQRSCSGRVATRHTTGTDESRPHVVELKLEQQQQQKFRISHWQPSYEVQNDKIKIQCQKSG